MWVEGSVIKPVCSWIRKSFNGDQHRQDNHPVVAKQLPTHFVTPAWMPFVILILGAYKCLELRLLLHGQYNLIPISIVGLILWMILLNCNLVSFQNCRLLTLLKLQTPLFIFSCWGRSRKDVKLDVLRFISCKDLLHRDNFTRSHACRVNYLWKSKPCSSRRYRERDPRGRNVF